MLSRKLFAAVLTTLIAFFIVPVFLYEESGTYFLIGLAVSTMAVPVLFFIGILSSIVIESYTGRRHIGWSFGIHLCFGVLCAIIFSLKMDGLLLTALLISLVYVTLFFIIDSMTKVIEEKNIQK
ncbi:hypothetical protein [Lysinibacillus sp. 54212]|uniref:hypothetical protein n=1 Tax=Lysinibacillus sp. 54212 TaxID=3119829 RepID=UPI002FC5EE5A